MFGVLAVTGLAWGQHDLPPSPRARAKPKDRFVTVQEAGKPPQRCKVLKMWTEPDGTPAFQAQALDTGELMTIEETGRRAQAFGALVRSASMRIFHWGRQRAVAGGHARTAAQRRGGRPSHRHPSPGAAPAPRSPPSRRRLPSPRKQWPSALAAGQRR